MSFLQRAGWRKTLLGAVIAASLAPISALTQEVPASSAAVIAQRRAELLRERAAIDAELRALDNAPASTPAPITAATPPTVAPLPEIVVTAPKIENVTDHPTGQTFFTIDEQKLKDTTDFTIGQSLEWSPGVTVKLGNGPRDIGVSIRGSNDRNGFGVRNIQVFEDGFPQTQPDGLSRTDLTDPHAYSSIDVYEGPSSVLFGNYATGGAINFHTRAGGEIDGFELGSDAGSFGYFNEYASLGKKFDAYEYSLFGSQVRGNGYITNSVFKTTTEDLLGTYTPTLFDKFTFKFVNNDVSTQLPIRLSLNQYQQNPYQTGCSIGAPLGCATVTLDKNGFNTSGGTSSLSASQAGLGRSDRRTIAGVRWEHNIDNATTWRTQFVFDDKDINQPTGTTSARGAEPAFNLISDVTRHAQLFGLDATHFGGIYFNYANLNNDTYNLTPAGGATLGALTSQYFGREYNEGAHAREEINLTPAVTGFAGVAVESTDIEITDNNYAYPTSGSPSITLIPVANNYLNYAYEAGIRYRPDDTWMFHVRTATGYGTPQASQLLITPQGVAGNNTQLKTQTNRGYDLGVDWTPSPAAHLGLTGFWEFFTNEQVTQSPGAGLSSYTFNAPASEHRGVEVNASWLPLPGWRYDLAYTYDNQYYTNYSEQLSAGTQTASFNRDGKTIPGVQPNFLTTRLAYDQPDGVFRGLGAYAEYQWRGGFFIDNANLVQVPSYSLVNLNLHYTPDFTWSYLKGVTMFFEVDNLFDRIYVASANNVTDTISSTNGAQNGAATVATATGSIYAGSPRAFVGGMKLKF